MKKALAKASAFFNDVCLTANDVGFANDVHFVNDIRLRECVKGKHHIIASETSGIIFATQIHHIAAGDTSLKNKIMCDMI